MTSRIDWNGSDQTITRGMRNYTDKVYEAIRAVAEYFAPVLESYAKENASWIDRTGNARQTLHAFTEDLSREAVALYLAHGMDYGKFLELRFSGRYAIILPTLEAHYGAVGDMLRSIFS